MSDHRIAWIDTGKFTAKLFYGDDKDYLEYKGLEEPPYDADTPPVRIEFLFPGRRFSTVINLSRMTAPGLVAFKQFMDYAFEKALPICERLDEKAKEAFENGNDSFVRLYQPIPKFYVRERDGEEHNPRVQVRSVESARTLADQPSGEIRNTGEPNTRTDSLDAGAGGSGGVQPPELLPGKPDGTGNSEP